MEEKQIELKKTALLLPENPGVYLFLDKNEIIIYVGKAKNLKKRVSSYFSKIHDSFKTNTLVKYAVSINHIVVETETDALLLENNLIKKYKPRYNVLLKDDKTYPWICIKNEPFPRVFQTRNLIKDSSKYFGPYTSVRLIRTLFELFKQIFQLRSCSYNLSSDKIKKNNYKVCLEYHIGNCKAPCISLQKEADYLIQIEQISNILKGNFTETLRFLKTQMFEFSNIYEFEIAQKIKNKIEILSEYQNKSTVVSNTLRNVDVFSILADDKFAYVNFLKVVNGCIIQVHSIEIKKKLDETEEELLSLAIVEIYQNKLFGMSDADEIILPFDIEFDFLKKKIVVPTIGDKKKLLELSQRNVFYFRLEKIKKETLVDPERHSKRILALMQTELHLPNLPVHIECFDNSNIQGTNPVAACVVFKNAKPSKKDYRKFNIKTVSGPNDFATMEEIILRRYGRLLNENQKLPDLIIVDGGKGQLSSAVSSLQKLNLSGKIPIIGIAKRLEEIYFPGDSIPIYLNKNSETLKVIKHARDEAHRFGISFHRNKRSAEFIKLELESVNGIGKKTIELLYKKYKSYDVISKCTIDELKTTIGESKALILIEYFKKSSGNA